MTIRIEDTDGQTSRWTNLWDMSNNFSKFVAVFLELWEHTTKRKESFVSSSLLAGR
jgi:hypothetical protein